VSDVARCPVCGCDSPVSLVARDFNRRTSREEFRYHRCLACGLVFAREPPHDLAQHYPLGYVTPPRSLAELQRIAARIRYQLDIVQAFVRSGRLLEIGPGYGSFLWLAKAAGFTVEAIEADATACAYLGCAVRVPVLKSDSPERVLSSRAEAYDAIVLWHAIEHLPHAWATLREAARAVNPEGVIVIATPNPLAWQFRVLGRRWPHLDAPRHLWLIPLDVLDKYLQPFGFSLAFATTGDAGGRRWDRFGWSQTLVNLLPEFLRNTLLVKIASRLIGHIVALIARPWERTAMKGSAYTAVFQKRNTVPFSPPQPAADI
jgi:2-polyprenyl-3-methyl-5-hydroxy-6-metoxy-1,4-benzoquinol methylase